MRAHIFSRSRSNPPGGVAASIGKNTLGGILAATAQIGTRFITVPIVIAHLGLGGYGIWSILMSLTAYMRFGSVGIKCAFQKYVAESTSTGDVDRVNKLLSTGTFGILLLSILLLLPLSFAADPIIHLLGVPSRFRASTAASLSLLALLMVVSNTCGVYEAILMGGHRIDVAKRFLAIGSILEAVAICSMLYIGYGLFAMACVMGLSETLYLLCCFIASRRLLPHIYVSARLVTSHVLPELFRFALSYQLVSMLQLLYNAIVPVTLLRTCGADASGIYAIASRLLQPVTTLQEAFLLPVLSGASGFLASTAKRSAHHIHDLLATCYKITLSLTILPLSFISAFGTLIVLAWTGQTDQHFRQALWLVALSSLFSGISMISVVLYRASGRGLLDTIREGLRLVTLLTCAYFTSALGFYGVLGGLALSEFFGMVIMLTAIAYTFAPFRMRVIVTDAVRMALSATGVVAVGFLINAAPFPELPTLRASAAIRLFAVFVACVVASWPLLVCTGTFTLADGKVVLDILLPRRAAALLDAWFARVRRALLCVCGQPLSWWLLA